MNSYKYKEISMPITGDVVWIVNDSSLTLNNISLLIEDFINKYMHIDFSLSIFDSNTAKTIEIDCEVNDIPNIVEFIYHLEKGTPLTFIGVNSVSKSYVVGMSISKGRMDFGCYKAENGTLLKC